MAHELKGQTISLKANAEITKVNKFKPVAIAGDNMFKLAGDTDKVVGIIQNECKAGEAGQVMISGVTFFKCTAEVAAGATVGNWGVALQSGAVGDLISVIIK